MDAPCLTIPGGRRWSYDEIDALSARMAGALRAAGAKPGDRIAVQVEKSAENVALYLASLRAGLVYVPLNTAYTPDEVAYFLNSAGPSVFVCDPARRAALRSTAEEAGVATVLTLGAAGEGSLIEQANAAAPS